MALVRPGGGDTPPGREPAGYSPLIKKIHPAKEGNFVSQSTTIPASAIPVPVTAPRMVAVIVQGTECHVPCPSWCIEDHAGARLVELADLAHFGAELSVQLPTFSGATESSVTVHLASYPFSVRDDRNPHLSLVSPSGDSTTLSADLAETVAQGLERHAAMMRALSAASATD